MPAEAGERSEYRTPIIVAVIGLIGVLGAALIQRMEFPTSRPPLIEEFTVSPQKITAGEKVVLGWRVKNADHVAIDPGLLAGSVPEGTSEVRPGRTTSYMLIASNRSGVEARQSASVEVAPRSEHHPPQKGGPPPKQQPPAGQQQPSNQQSPLTIIYEQNVNRPDSTWDLDVLNVGAKDHHACDAPCLGRADCKSYVYIKPGVRGPDAYCVLKSELPIAALNQPCCITGIVKKRALVSRP